MSFSNLRSFIPQRLVNILWHLPKAILANIYYGFPSRDMIVIGVTGTDGKTTTASMIYHILHNCDFPVALISTVSAKIGKEEIDTGFHVTTPDPFLIQKFLGQMHVKGIKYVVLESTSHGLDQFRLWGINFFIGVVTNISMDHLDYHKNWDNYLLAKAKLFSKTKAAILNLDDKSYPKLKKKVSGKIFTYGEINGDFNLKNTHLKLISDEKYNQLNALAAIAASQYLGIDKKRAINCLSSFHSVSGRMELIYAKPFAIYVDFAHTPNALQNALMQLKNKSKGRIWAIFGCAGNRDPFRRRMGEVSAQISNITIITAEDPREEGVEKISNEIAAWAQKTGAVEINPELGIKNQNGNQHYFMKIPDRKQAIEYALTNARPNDIVGIFGKGHEKSMCFGKTEVMWSDQQVVKDVWEELKLTNIQNFKINKNE